MGHHEQVSPLSTLQVRPFKPNIPALLLILQTTRNVCQCLHCHMLLFYISLGYLWKWICSYLDKQVSWSVWSRPPYTYWKSWVELFLLEVRIKSTLGVVLRDKMVHYERRIQNICLFNTQTFLNYRSQTKKQRWEKTIGLENKRT